MARATDQRRLPGLAPDDDASFSACGTYRYSLQRDLGGARAVTFVMLNPSTADAVVNDPTVTRCINYARAWGFGRLYVVNLFAFRSTDPKALTKTADPIGPDNDAVIAEHARKSELVIAAWGNDGVILGRDVAVCELLWTLHVELHALRVNKATGCPAHPLYLPKTLTPTPYPGRS